MRLLAVTLSSLVLVALPSSAIPADLSPADQALLQRYVEARQIQQNALKGMQMQVEINGKLPSLAKQGKLLALRSISMLGKITYKALGFTGDSMVKQEVISRYLSAEVQGGDGHESLAISPENYKFRVKATIDQGGQRITVFEINPRKKRVGLFKGELWVDTATGMPLRESGRMVKNPSVFLKKVEFTQYYELENGVALPKELESRVETRLVGKAELKIAFSHYSKADPDDTRVAGTN